MDGSRMIPLGAFGAAIPRIRAGVQWVGEAEAVPAGAQALILAWYASPGIPAAVDLNGQPAAEIAVIRNGVGDVRRSIAAWWLPSPAPGGPTVPTVTWEASPPRHWLRCLFVTGGEPGEHASASGGAQGWVPPALSPAVQPDGVVVSALAGRGRALFEPSPPALAADAFNDNNSVGLSAAWAVSDTVPVGWAGPADYGTHLAVAINPTGA